MRKGTIKGNRYKIFKNRAQIILGDHLALIDVADVGIIKQFTWRVIFDRKPKSLRLYLCTDYWLGQTHLYLTLHRHLLNAEKGTIIDHINGNPLDNRRSNLRFVTRSQNGMNRKANAGKDTPAGVSFLKSRGEYRIYLTKNGQKRFFGAFKNKEEAEAKAVEAKNDFYGEYSPHWKKGN